MSPEHRKIGVLTGGGDAPGLNAVIRAVVKAGTNSGMEVIGLEDSFDGLLDSTRSRRLTPHDVTGILRLGGTILGTTNRGNPFEYPTEGGKADYSDRVVETFGQMGLDALVVIGGDGTLAIAHQLYLKGIPVVGVPKTIDNDIVGTTSCFGFDTAVSFATDAIDRLHTTAQSHKRIMVVEVMGRYAGWIALHAGMAGGADVILVPEIPYDLQRVCDKVRRRQAAGRFFSIVVVAEGAMEAGQDQKLLDANTDGGKMPRLGGAGQHVAAEISRRTGIETRVTVLGHLQRGGTPTAYDRFLATRFGIGAVELTEAGRWGDMVALQGTEVVGVPIRDVIGKLKHVDPNGQVVGAARGLGIEFGG